MKGELWKRISRNPHVWLTAGVETLKSLGVDTIFGYPG